MSKQSPDSPPVKPGELAVYSKKAVAQRPPAKTRRHLFHRTHKRNPSRDQIYGLLSQWFDALPEQEARMLRGVFSLADTYVREVMTPLSEVFAVPVSTRVGDLKPILRDRRETYIPVYEERIDRFTGIVNILDLLYAEDPDQSVGELLRSAYYVPETKIIAELLEELRVADDPIAIVVEEHGSCVGVVTLEDILEEIVGEIGPMDHKPPPAIHAADSNTWVVDARTDIDVVNRTLGLQIPKDRCDTIGGFVLKLFGRIPEEGEKVEFDGREFLVADVFDYGISEIHISNLPPPDPKRASR